VFGSTNRKLESLARVTQTRAGLPNKNSEVISSLPGVFPTTPGIRGKEGKKKDTKGKKIQGGGGQRKNHTV